MDPLIIHHVIRHRLSRIETNNFQDKSGCSINGFRSFLFEEGMVEDLYDVENLINNYDTIRDYRGYPIQFSIITFKNFPLSDEILRMKYINFYFQDQSKPIHKLVSPEPHFVEEEMNLIENHFYYMRYTYKSDDIEEWDCFEMDCEGHLVSLKSFQFPRIRIKFHLSNESIEHLSNFPHLRNITIPVRINEEELPSFSFLSNLKNLTIIFCQELEDPELLKDLGLFSNLLYLDLRSHNGF